MTKLMVTNEELAYTAGIVDGEGSISIAKHKDGHNFNYVLQVAVDNASAWLIMWLDSTYGGSISRYKPKEQKHSEIFRWTTSGRGAMKFLEFILPYLQIKKPQAEIAIKFVRYRKKQAGGYSSFNHPRFTEEELALQEADHILMCSLNKKGNRDGNPS